MTCWMLDRSTPRSILTVVKYRMYSFLRAIMKASSVGVSEAWFIAQGDSAKVCLPSTLKRYELTITNSSADLYATLLNNYDLNELKLIVFCTGGKTTWRTLWFLGIQCKASCRAAQFWWSHRVQLCGDKQDPLVGDFRLLWSDPTDAHWSLVAERSKSWCGTRWGQQQPTMAPSSYQSFQWPWSVPQAW